MALPCCCFVILNQCLFQLKFAEQKLNTQSLLGRINLVIFDTKNRKILTNLELGDVCQDTFGRFSRPAFANRFLHAARFLANCTANKNQRRPHTSATGNSPCAATAHHATQKYAWFRCRKNTQAVLKASCITTKSSRRDPFISSAEPVKAIIICYDIPSAVGGNKVTSAPPSACG